MRSTVIIGLMSTLVVPLVNRPQVVIQDDLVGTWYVWREWIGTELAFDADDIGVQCSWRMAESRVQFFRPINDHQQCIEFEGDRFKKFRQYSIVFDEDLKLRHRYNAQVQKGRTNATKWVVCSRPYAFDPLDQTIEHTEADGKSTTMRVWKRNDNLVIEYDDGATEDFRLAREFRRSKPKSYREAVRRP